MIGLISYPLYLWHWPLLSFAHLLEGGVPSASLRLTLLGASVALGVGDLPGDRAANPIRGARPASRFRRLPLVLTAVAAPAASSIRPAA